MRRTCLALVGGLALGLAGCGHNIEERAATGAGVGLVVAGPVGAAVGAGVGAIVSKADDKPKRRSSKTHSSDK